MNNPTMNDSVYIQRLKQKIWEKQHPRVEQEDAEQESEQINFNKFMGDSYGRGNDKI